MRELDRYILDPLYGPIQLPEFLWRLACTPEVQRLREVRMCNINSLSLTGGANINRYEHAIGTTHLAMECLKNWPRLLPAELKREVVIAALVHDVNSAAFGHSVEYVFSTAGFDHAELDETFLDKSAGGSKFAYRRAQLQPVFFGLQAELPEFLSRDDLTRVAALVRGEGPLGPLISGSLDLDNLDNVYRLAYHYGIIRDSTAALKLARMLWVEDGRLRVPEEAVDLLLEWREVRRKLYRFLLLNPDEFSGKCMLEEALFLGNRGGKLEYNWRDVDYQLLSRLDRADADAQEVVRRLMVGDLYGCVAIFSSPTIEVADSLRRNDQVADFEKRLGRRMERRFGRFLKGALVRLHTIVDINKTDRPVDVVVEGEGERTFGEGSRRLLIGVFLKNRRFSALQIDRQRLGRLGLVEEVMTALGTEFGLAELESQRLYEEVAEV